MFSGMWQFPAVEIRKNAQAELGRYLRKISERDNAETPSAQKHAEKDGARHAAVELAGVRHSVTYREITLRPFLMRVGELPEVEGGRVTPLDKLTRLPVSSATWKIARAVQQRILSGQERN